MRLVDVASVRSLLGFEDMTDINAAITGALEQATPILESYLQSRFDRVSLTDRFFIPDHRRATSTSPPMTQLYLTSGLVLAGSITVKGVDTWDDLSSATALTTMKPHTNRGLERGVLNDTDTVYGTSSYISRLTQAEAGPYIEVSYSCGFEADGTDPAMYHTDQVPSWLKEAAKLTAMVNLEKHPVVASADVDYDVDQYRNSARSILQPYKRYAPSAHLPL